jgi:type IV pilus assembly protein PilM
LVLSPPDVRFCALRLPGQALAQPEKQVRETLAWELAREMRTDADQLEVRYWQLPPGHQQGLNVMAVALPTARALAWHELFARDHLHLRRIDVAPCALVHLASRIWAPTEDELWGVLDLGFRRTTLTAVLGQVPVYTRSLPISSDSWTRRLAEAFEVAHAGAEQIKRTHGIQPVERGLHPPQSDRPLANAQDIPSVLFGLLREPLDDLVREIGKCFAYVMQNFSDADASRLLLAGGGANLGGLVEYFELQLGLSVGLLASTTGSATVPSPGPRPWEHPLPDTTIRPELAAAVGGALLGLENP